MAIFGDNFPTIFDDNFKNICHVGLWRERHLIFATSVSFNEKEEKEKMKKWVPELFRKREEKGAFYNLIQKLKLANRDSFFR